VRAGGAIEKKDPVAFSSFGEGVFSTPSAQSQALVEEELNLA